MAASIEAAEVVELTLERVDSSTISKRTVRLVRKSLLVLSNRKELTEVVIRVVEAVVVTAEVIEEVISRFPRVKVERTLSTGTTEHLAREESLRDISKAPTKSLLQMLEIRLPLLKKEESSNKDLTIRRTTRDLLITQTALLIKVETGTISSSNSNKQETIRLTMVSKS